MFPPKVTCLLRQENPDQQTEMGQLCWAALPVSMSNMGGSNELTKGWHFVRL